jgi:four helix bundle protein
LSVADIQSYRDLLVWQEAMNLAEASYRLTFRLPSEERFGLSSQVRRSAASVPANIAEGYGRDNLGSYIQHLRIAQGSLKELETHLLLAGRVQMLSDDLTAPVHSLAETVGKLLRALIRSLEKKDV